MRRIILIGGSPTAGKSWIARAVSRSMKIPWISTDTIREQMREIVRREDFPDLFLHAKATPKMAADFLKRNSPKEIVKLQNMESIDVWKGVRALVETDYVWGDFIIEGIAVLPHLVKGLKRKDMDIRCLFLIDENRARVKRSIFSRGLWDDADRYPDSLKEKEIEWVMEFNSFVKEETKRLRFPVLSIEKRKDTLKRVLARVT